MLDMGRLSGYDYIFPQIAQWHAQTNSDESKLPDQPVAVVANNKGRNIQVTMQHYPA